MPTPTWNRSISPKDEPVTAGDLQKRDASPKPEPQSQPQTIKEERPNSDVANKGTFDAPRLTNSGSNSNSYPSHLDKSNKGPAPPASEPQFNFPPPPPPIQGERGPLHMPHRVEPYPMSSLPPSHRRHYDSYDAHPQSHHRRSSPPPPITTLTHSPSTSVSSLDRSAVGTPPVRRSPPHSHIPPPHSIYASSPYQHDPALMSRQPAYRSAEPHLHAYMYAPPHHQHPMDQRAYDHHHPHDGQSPYLGSAGLPPHMMPPMQGPRSDHYASAAAASGPYPMHPSQQPLPGGVGSAVFTDDAATKLSDRVRRRCFNCCTTDTSTWRRSNLSPGKVLCNKCGLFERTHSRPRPEQFPHKRGPLSGATLRSRTPPQQLPPIGSPPGFHYTHPPPPPPGHQHQGMPPPQHHQPHPDSGRRDYPSPPMNGNGNGIASNGTTLPALQNWHPQQQHPEASPQMPPPNPHPQSRRSTLDGGSGGGSNSNSNHGGSAAGSRGPSPPLSRPTSTHSQHQTQQSQEPQQEGQAPV